MCVLMFFGRFGIHLCFPRRQNFPGGHIYLICLAPKIIPVSVYIQEADTLCKRALQYKEELVAAGVRFTSLSPSSKNIYLTSIISLAILANIVRGNNTGFLVTSLNISLVSLLKPIQSSTINSGLKFFTLFAMSMISFFVPV